MIRSNDDQVIARLERRMADLPGRLDDVLVDAGRDALERVRGRTPVDTGALLSGWSLEARRGHVVLENEVRYAGFALDELHIEDVVDVDRTGAELARLLEG